MNKSAISLATICLLGSAVIYAQAQRSKAELDVAGVTLHLGMTKAEVTAKLAGQQYWKMNDDNWVVSPPNDIGPSIQFTNGRLNFTERFWATNENDTGMALFGAVSSLNKDGFHTCEVTAGVNASPDLTAHNVWISCGEKSVLSTRQTIGDHSYTMVHEELGRSHTIEK